MARVRVLTEEQRLRKLERDRLSKAKRRAEGHVEKRKPLTEEQRVQRRARARARWAERTPEQVAADRARSTANKAAQKARRGEPTGRSRMSDEQRMARNNASARRRWAARTPEQIEAHRARKREAWRNLPDEKRQAEIAKRLERQRIARQAKAALRPPKPAKVPKPTGRPRIDPAIRKARKLEMQRAYRARMRIEAGLEPIVPRKPKASKQAQARKPKRIYFCPKCRVEMKYRPERDGQVCIRCYRAEQIRLKEINHQCIECKSKTVSKIGSRCVPCGKKEQLRHYARLASERAARQVPRNVLDQKRREHDRKQQHKAALTKRKKNKWYMQPAPDELWLLAYQCAGPMPGKMCESGPDGMPAYVLEGQCYQCATGRKRTFHILAAKLAPEVSEMIEDIEFAEKELVA